VCDPAAELKDVGFKVGQLKAAGFSATELKNVGYTVCPGHKRRLHRRPA
jgi:hypothetical protein